MIASVLVCCAGCCISSDTKILSRKIANSTAKQEKELAELSDMKLNTGKKISETQRGKILLRRASSLSTATSGLADLVGAPEEVE